METSHELAIRQREHAMDMAVKAQQATGPREQA